MEYESRLYKGFAALASLLHVKRATAEVISAAREAVGAMDDEVDEFVEPEDDWDDDEDE